MPKKSKLDQKREEIQHLDIATQAVINRIDKNDRRLRTWGFFTLLLLLAVGVIGIYRQNSIAIANKKHIDCIIKDLATPQRPGTTHKYIANLQTDCNIKFTP